MFDIYNTVILKDGRIGCIVDVSGDVGYIVDVGSSPEDWETIAVTKEEVEGLADINPYDEIETVDGVVGCVVDRYNFNDTCGDDLFIVDIGDSPSTWITIDVKRKDIKRRNKRR